MHIYPWQIDPMPLLQSTIDLWKTTTPVQADPIPPPPIDHRFVENHYTKYVSYIAEYTYTHGRLNPTPISIWPEIYGRPLHQLCFTYRRMHRYQCRQTPSLPPPIDHRFLENHYTKEVSYIAECTHTQDRWTSHQSIIDACNTTTSDKFHIEKNAHIPKADGPPHQSIIDACNTTTLDRFHMEKNVHIPKADRPPSIDHRCMQHHYTG